MGNNERPILKRTRTTTLMLLIAPSRRLLYPFLVAGLLIVFSSPGFARGLKFAAVRPGPPAPHAAPPPHQAAAPRQSQPQVKPNGQTRQNQEHLEEWMDRHRSLTPEQQQKALENEPGFKQLPPQEQQRLSNLLTRLNNMPEEQRRRTIARTEALEHLTPAQRQQVKGTMQQYNALPADRRRLVARAFRDLREMPDPQRQAILSSDRFHSQFNDNERSTLNNLLAVEPYIPVEQHPSDTVNSGKQ
jgi:hypothetical protein